MDSATTFPAVSTTVPVATIANAVISSSPADVSDKMQDASVAMPDAVEEKNHRGTEDGDDKMQVVGSELQKVDTKESKHQRMGSGGTPKQVTPQKKQSSKLAKVLDIQEDTWKRFTPEKINRSRCLARTWNDGCGGQCTKTPAEGQSLCKGHLAKAACGLVDSPIPLPKLHEFVKHSQKTLKKESTKTAAWTEDAPMGFSAEGASKGDAASITGQALPKPKRVLKCKTPPSEIIRQNAAQEGTAKKPRAKNKARLNVKGAGELPATSQEDVVQTAPKKKARLSADTPGAANKPQAKKKARESTKEGALPTPAVVAPYGANYVKQDLRRRKRQTVAAGTTKVSKQVKKYYSHNGRLKSEFRRSFKDTDEGKCGYKEQRRRHLKVQALATKTLVDVSGCCGYSGQLFSPAVTKELVDMIRNSSGDALGAIASQRLPDAFLSEGSPAMPVIQSAPSHDDTTDHVAMESNHEEPGVKDKVAEHEPLDEVPDEVRMFDAHEASSAPNYSMLKEEQSATSGVNDNLPHSHPVADSRDNLTRVLQDNFRHQDFRPGQREAISSVLAGIKTLLLLSTGSGKSLCYQIPAYLLREEGLTLVISPLISLMSDQLVRLPLCLRGAFVSSQQSRDQVRDIMRMVRARTIDVLFISPERLSMWSSDGCGLPPIALACIDEAHCVSEWSHNFRPDYLRLNEFLMQSLGARRLLALTATATRPTVRSICEILRVESIVRCDKTFTLQEILKDSSQPPVQRKNLVMEVYSANSEESQMAQLVRILRSEDTAKSSTIIYVWKRMTADQLAKRLRTVVPGGVRSYHGSMLPEQRKLVQDAFMSGMTRVVVATMAFGMGLDKPDIRTVIHFNLPKSIENYIQETGRCSRDGAMGRCISIVNAEDYKVMRWMESGSGGSSSQSGIVRRLIRMLFAPDTNGPVQHYQVTEEAAANEVDGPAPQNMKYIAFEETEMSKSLTCPPDELHSSLVRLAHYAGKQVQLFSRFPTRLKLRFFKTDPQELVKQDPFLRKLLPMAKKVTSVYTIETAKALSVLGGKPSQLSDALWKAQGDEFTVEKANYGYMMAMMRPVEEAEMESWAAEISSINTIARENSVQKLDAVFIALTRAAAAATQNEAKEHEEADDEAPTTNSKLSELIDTYFAATEDPSAVVAGDPDERKRLLSTALGSEYSHAMKTGRFNAVAAAPAQSQNSQANSTSSTQDRIRKEQAAVYPTVARLLVGAEWPKLPSDDLNAEAHLAAQFLAGIGSMLLPVQKWKHHPCWGRFRGNAAGEFETLEELVIDAVHRLRRLKRNSTQAELPGGVGSGS